VHIGRPHSREMTFQGLEIMDEMFFGDVIAVRVLNILVLSMKLFPVG